MSKIKYAPGLNLGLIELNRTFEFLEQEGFRKLLLANSYSFGLIKKIGIPFINTKVIESNTLSAQGFQTVDINPIQAIDSVGNYLETKTKTSITIPLQNQWYWLQAKYTYTNIEQGLFKIDSLGNLSATGIDLTKVLKGGSDCPTKISFPNSIINIQEYEVLEVINEQNAVLAGDFVDEINLKMAVVGGFISDIQVPATYKYPYQFDSATFTLIPEAGINTMPAYIEGQEFFVARIKAVSAKVTIQDKRSMFLYKSKAEGLIDPQRPSTIGLNPLMAVESIKFQNTDPYQVNDKNIVRIGWGLRTSAWNFITATNTLNIISIGDTGQFKNLSDFGLINLAGWRVLCANGNSSIIVDSALSGDLLQLNLDTFDVSDVSVGGEYTTSKEYLTIVPDITEVSIRFRRSYLKEGSETFDTNYLVSTHKAHLGYADILVPTVDDKTYYTVEYKQHTLTGESGWILIPSNSETGYYQESAFDDSGDLKLVAFAKPYTSTLLSGFIELNINPNSYNYTKKEIDKNKFETVYNSFSGTNNVIRLVPGRDGVFQVFNESNSLSSASQNIFIDLSILTYVSGSFFVLQFFNNIVIGDKTLYIGSGYGTNDGNRFDKAFTLKQINIRDISQSRNIDGGIKIDCLYNGNEWTVSQNYELGKKGEIVMFHGPSEGQDQLDACFDYTSGAGKAFGWIGYALCDGRNGTPDLRGRFVVGYDGSHDPTKDYGSIGNSGGQEFITLATPELPSLGSTVALNIGNRGADVSGDSLQHLSVVAKSPTNGMKNYPIDLGGKDKPHENRPPYIVLAYAKRIY